MPDLDELVVKVTADTGELQGKLREGGAAVDQFGNKVASAGKSTESFNDAQKNSVTQLDKLIARFDPQTKGLQNLAQVQAQVTKAQASGTQLTQQQTDALERITARFAPAGIVARAFAEAVSGVKGQLVALAAGAGPVGVFLAGLGPWGLAAAAGLGLASAAFEKAKDVAQKFADKAQAIREFARATDFTTTQVQALEEANAKHGVRLDETRSAVQRFTVAWEQARKGGGEMLEQINRIDGSLALDLQRARDVTAAWDLFSAALTRADTSTRNLLLRAAGGKQGITALGGIAADTAAAGGIRNLVSPDAIPPQVLENAQKLRNEIEQIRQRTDNIWGGMFAPQTLEAQKQSALTWQRIAESIQSIVGTAESRRQWLFGLLGARPPTQPAAASAPPFQSPAADLALRNAPAPLDGPSALTPEAILARSRAVISILGEAATQTEIYRNRQLELADAAIKAGVSQGFVGRALEALRTNQRLANDAARESLGVSTEGEIVATRLIALREQEARGLQLTIEQRERAIAAIKREAQAQDESNQIRSAALPGLKQMEIDAGRVDKAFDQASVSGISTMASSLTDIQTGTINVSEGFSKMAQSIGRSVLQMINQMLLARSVGLLLQSAFNLFSAPTGAAAQPAQAAVAGYPAGFVGPIPTGHGGGMGYELTGNRFVHAAYYDASPRFHDGRLGAGEMAAIIREDESVLTPGQMRAVAGMGSPQINLNVINNAPGVDLHAGRPKQNESGGFDVEVLIEQIDGALAQRQADGTGAHARVLSTQFGLSRKY